MANCAVCKEDIQPRSVCPRCGSDNQGVRDVTFGYFTSIWAILSFLLILGPLFMLLPKVLSWVDGVFQPIASVRVAAPIALLLTLVIAFFLFSMRDDLHETHQSRTFREKQGTPLPIRALQFFIAAVILTFLLGFAVTSKDLLIGTGRGQIAPGSTGHLLFGFVMTGILVMVFSFFALASRFMAVYEFGLYAEERTPDPIYLNEQLMLKVVLQSVKTQLDDHVELALSQMRRTPDAGVSLQLHQEGELRTVGDEKLLEEKGWLVEADKWARLRKMVEHGERTIQIPKE